MALPSDTSDSVLLRPASALATTPESLATSGIPVGTTPHAAAMELLSDVHGKGLEGGVGSHGIEAAPERPGLPTPLAIHMLPVSSASASVAPLTPAHVHQHAPAVESQQVRQTVAQLGLLVT